MTAATKGFTTIVEKLLTAGSEAVNGAAGRDNVEETAKLLAAVVVNHYTGGLLGDVQRPSCTATLLRVADHMSERHNILFSSIVRRLEVTPENILPSFTNVVDEMFADGQYNWGRIVTVYAFAGWLARYCCCRGACDASSVNKVSGHDPESAKDIADRTGDYVAERLSTWIRKQGGWDVMDQFFTDREDPEGALWHGLLYTFVGLGALAAMAAVR